MKLLKLIKINILSVISVKAIIYVCFVFTLTNYINKGIYHIESFNDIVKFSFYGINSLKDSPIELFKMILMNIFPIYVACNTLNTKINNRNLFTIIRVNNKYLLFNSIVASTFIICFLYYFIGSVILIILNFELVSLLFDFRYFIKVIILEILANFSICLFGMLLNSFIKNKSFVFCLINLLYFLSSILGDLGLNINKWLLFNQGTIKMQSYIGFTFGWTYYYTTINSLILYFFMRKRIVRNVNGGFYE